MTAAEVREHETMMCPFGLVSNTVVRLSTRGPTFTKQIEFKILLTILHSTINISVNKHMHRNLIIYMLKFTNLLKCNIFFDTDYYHFIPVSYLVILLFLTSFLTDPTHSTQESRLSHPQAPATFPFPRSDPSIP